MDKIKCITFDKKAQDSTPDDIHLKMNIDREKAESNMNKTWNKSNPTEKRSAMTDEQRWQMEQHLQNEQWENNMSNLYTYGEDGFCDGFTNW